MPITLTAEGAGTTQFGIGSVLLVGDRASAAAASDLDNISDFHNIQYNFQTAEIAGNAPGVEIPIIGNTPDEFPFQQGPLDIINGFTLPGYTESMEPFYRNLMNDERALTAAQSTAPSLTSTESGGRLARVAEDAVADGIAISTSPVTTGLTPPVGGVPIRLSVLPSAAVSGNPRITIRGTDYNDGTISETVTLTGTTAVVTNLFFKTITSVTASASASQTLKIGGSAEASDRGYVSIFRENENSRLLYGQDVYLRKGTVPNTFREVFLNSMSFALSARETPVAYTFGCVGKRPLANTFVDGEGTEGAITFDFATREAFVGWQAGLFYRPPGASEDARLPVIDATVTITNNIAFTPTITGRRTPGSTFRSRRSVTMTGTMEYKAEDTELINDVLGNEFLEGTYLEFVNATRGGYPKRTRFTFGRLQFDNLPDAPVSEEGLISRPMSLRAVPTAVGVTPALPAIHITLDNTNPTPLTAITL